MSGIIGLTIAAFSVTRRRILSYICAGIAVGATAIAGAVGIAAFFRIIAGAAVGVVSGAAIVRAAFSIVYVQRFKTGYHFLLRIVLL